MGITGFAGGVMKRWDDLLTRYDRSQIHSLLGGRVKYGYPPTVKDVDVWLPAKASYLKDTDTIMSIRSATGVEWSLVARGVKQKEIHALPCGHKVLVGEWIVDIRLEKQVYASTLSFTHRSVINETDGSLVFSDWYQVICYQKSGAMWLRSGLFEGDMYAAELENGKIICKGQLDWLKITKDATIVLDATTGNVIGGDEEAVEIAGKLVPKGDILKIYKV